MNWNVILQVALFFVLKIFLESIFIFPINLFNFCKFPIQTALRAPLGFGTQWIVIFKSEEDLISFDKFMPLFEIS